MRRVSAGARLHGAARSAAADLDARVATVSAVEFVVYGHPATAGSKRAFAIRRDGKFTGRVAVVDDAARTKSWQGRVAQAAAETGAACERGPVKLALAFYLHRPRAHYGTGRNDRRLRPSAPAWHCKRPDVLKLARAVEDALTGVLWHDDAQVCEEALSKHYTDDGESERVRVRVTRLATGLTAVPLPGQLELPGPPTPPET